MKTTSPILHPSFQLNGLDISSAEELLNFTDDLLHQGAPYEISVARFIEQWLDFSDSVNVITSGSTGTPKELNLAKSAMIESAKATGAYFKLGPGTKALLCLSADYIAGKMMLVRAMTLGWDLHVVAPEADALTEYDNDYDFVAMVPYQVHHSLSALGKVKKLIVGGGPVSKTLETALQESPVEAFATYGMTETITHIAVRRINGFAKSTQFTALPNVNLSLDERSCLVIDVPYLTSDPIVTNDIVDLQSATSFTWIGRYDHIINSGGVKMNPEEIEAKLTAIDFPFIIASEKDPALGERVILVLENVKGEPIPNYKSAFDQLEKYERPKKMYTLSKFPYTETGKIKRGDVLKVLQKYKK